MVGSVLALQARAASIITQVTMKRSLAARVVQAKGRRGA